MEDKGINIIKNVLNLVRETDSEKHGKTIF
jgi:hypothetical protein